MNERSFEVKRLQNHRNCFYHDKDAESFRGFKLHIIRIVLSVEREDFGITENAYKLSLRHS